MWGAQGSCLGGSLLWLRRAQVQADAQHAAPSAMSRPTPPPVAAERARQLAAALTKAGFKPKDKFGIYSGKPGGSTRHEALSGPHMHVRELRAAPAAGARRAMPPSSSRPPAPALQPTTSSGCWPSAPATRSAAPSVRALEGRGGELVGSWCRTRAFHPHVHP